jgi:SAM-dependent methyltransferase
MGSDQQTLAGVYDEGAAAYERFWAPALHRHARDLVAAVPAAESGTARTVVDVAAGTGTLVPALRTLAGEAGAVIALDRSLGMLRLVPDGTPRVQADAAGLPLATSSVDVVVLAFVLFLLPDPRPAVAEAARVLRPGGWLLAATWGTQLGTAADVVAREELDDAGAPAFPALARSDDATDSAEDMAALLGEDFVDVDTSARPLEARFTAQSALAMRTGCGALGWRFSRLDQDTQRLVLDRAGERLRAMDEEAFVDRSEVLLTTARRR